MNWGKSIVLSFVLFAIFIGTLVTVCVRQDIALVSNDYYKQELNYQHQMETEQNTNKLTSKPEISIEANGELVIHFTELHSIENGEINLYAPGDIRRDRKFPLVKSSGNVHTISTAGLEKGKYKVVMRWSMFDNDYYYEQLIII